MGAIRIFSIWWFLFMFFIKWQRWCKVLCLINCNHEKKNIFLFSWWKDLTIPLKRHIADINRTRWLSELIHYAWQKIKLQIALCGRNHRAVMYFWNSFQFQWCKTSNSCFLSKSKHYFFKEWDISWYIYYWYYKRFSSNTIRIVLLYRSLSSSITTFYNIMESLLSESHVIDIVLGDFNIGILNSANINLQHVFSRFTASKWCQSHNWFPDRLCICKWWIFSEALHW